MDFLVDGGAIGGLHNRRRSSPLATGCRCSYSTRRGCDSASSRASVGADVDEPRGHWRVSQAVSKTGQGRWVSVPPVVFEAVLGLVAREDRTPERTVFQRFGGDRFRTAMIRVCTAAACRTSGHIRCDTPRLVVALGRMP